MTDLPAPLVAADVDLRGLAWMPYYGDHVARSQLNAHVSDSGYRAAHNLWWAAWNSVPAASLPDDDVALARLADLGRDVAAFLAVKREAMHGFVLCSDGRLYHRFLAALATDAWHRRVHDRDRKRAWRERQERERLARERGQDGDRTGTGRSRPGEMTGQDRTEEEERSPSRETSLSSKGDVSGTDRDGNGEYISH